MKPTNTLPILALTVVLAGTNQAAVQQFNFTTLAGPVGPGHSDGSGIAARFNNPTGVTADNWGNVYVADTENSTIRKITPAGVASTLAGLAGSPGSDDGTGSAARFNYPFGVTVDTAGNVYVADLGNYTIRKVTPAGEVTTLAGRAEIGDGSTDGTGSTARFYQPSGVAADSAGNLYVTDTGNRTIRKVTPAGVVTTLAGLAGGQGSANGTGSAARFWNPQGVAVDSAGNVYVADYSAIRKITPTGVVTTLAGLVGNPGNADGTGSAARFGGSDGVAVDSIGNLYVADSYNQTIRKVTSTGVVTTLAGDASIKDQFGNPVSGSADGTGKAARFYYPTGVALDGAGILYVADRYNNTIRKITLAGVVSTLAGKAGSTDRGAADGTGSVARFNYPYSVTVDGAGNVYVADGNGNRKVTSAGVVTTLAGLGGRAVAVDIAGNLYLVFGNSIAKAKLVGTTWVVTTLAGVAGEYGSADGTGSDARFQNPAGVAVDSAGIVYVADSGNGTIRKIMPGGSVSTLAGLAGSPGSEDATGNAARFGSVDGGPYGVAVDSVGNVYVADSGNGTIRKITPGGVVSTLAGLAGNFGSDDGMGNAARFGGCNGLGCGGPFSVAVDSAGCVYAADWPATIRKITPDGVVSTLGGLPRSRGSDDGTGIAARFNDPRGVAVDSKGNLYVADKENHKIRLGTPVLITQPAFGPNSLSRLSTGQFQIEVTASTNQLVLIQATSTFPATHWSTVQTVTLWNGRITLTDSDASSFPVRFYRAVSPVP